MQTARAMYKKKIDKKWYFDNNANLFLSFLESHKINITYNNIFDSKTE